jgi:hypothetical protein
MGLSLLKGTTWGYVLSREAGWSAPNKVQMVLPQLNHYQRRHHVRCLVESSLIPGTPGVHHVSRTISDDLVSGCLLLIVVGFSESELPFRSVEP